MTKLQIGDLATCKNMFVLPNTKSFVLWGLFVQDLKGRFSKLSNRRNEKHWESGVTVWPVLTFEDECAILVGKKGTLGNRDDIMWNKHTHIAT